ncbi:MAG TPA: hypothetical protein VFA48_11325 [Gammaproteobacteria bacterium]|nr:hypothetical protein [Gammaproteobacteria bacterium]
MKKIVLSAVGALMILTASNALGAGVTVLGVTVGVSKYSSVSALLAKKEGPTQMQLARYHRFSDLATGPALITTHYDYGVQGLSTVLYEFDSRKILKAVVLDFDMKRFSKIFSYLNGKYDLMKTNRHGFMDTDKYALFQAGDYWVYEHQPFMPTSLSSPSMQVIYASPTAWGRLLKKEDLRKLMKRKEEASKF